ncbi:hypothetical protein FNV43_RR16381 [Rhamnella rubrinervis]|uniref:Exonuclease domain-containing protein n=1 Tax=Rhamnella rubrinervis TaxID=2594499 RepID=A0A8K0GYP3_9ROSA|nr:hypothetical protein FNV43_RR16381 [Rhamnella rubrinervis]
MALHLGVWPSGKEADSSITLRSCGSVLRQLFAGVSALMPVEGSVRDVRYVALRVRVNCSQFILENFTYKAEQMMRSPRIPLSRFSVTALYSSSLSSLTPSHPLPVRSLRHIASVSAVQAQDPSPPPHRSLSLKNSENRWKPMCLYYTQGKCTMMDDPVHLEKFNHDCSRHLQIDVANLSRKRSQEFDYFLVLDLEGKIEILEFPVVMIEAKTMNVVDFFHRFVRPSGMSNQHINEYIEGKYGKLGVAGVWHDTAIYFEDVIQEFEAWLTQHHLWEKEVGRSLNGAAFVTCGNWDVKSKVPEQCKVSKIKLPSYFMKWINIKDVYLNFYKRRATGMLAMMNQLRIPLLGSHHLGLDDTLNISRVLQHMVADGALLQITAWKNRSLQTEFLFKDRIGHQG